MEAVRFLTNQHRALEAAFHEALDLDDHGAKRSRFVDIADALAMHLAAEEDVFYPAVHGRANEDLLLESLEEHLAMKRLLADLLERAGDDDTFQPKLKVLFEEAEHHHQEEERKLFPGVQERMSLAHREELGLAMEGWQGALQAEGRPRCAMPDQTSAARSLDR